MIMAIQRNPFPIEALPAGCCGGHFKVL